MSTQATTWAWKQAPSRPTDKYVLVALANFAWPDGTHAFPSIATLAGMTGLSERTVQRSVDNLVADGLVLRARNAGGTPAYRADRRPNLYTLPISTGADERGDSVTPRAATGCHPRQNGVSSTTERGVTVTPNTKKNPYEPTPKQSDIEHFLILRSGTSEFDTAQVADEWFGAHAPSVMSLWREREQVPA